MFGLDEGERLERMRDALVRVLALTTKTLAPMLLLFVAPHEMRIALAHRLLRDVDRLLYEEIAARRGADDLDERSDVLSILLRALHADGHPMGDAEIRDVLITLLLTGHETMASGLAWAVERIVRQPDVQSRLAHR